MSVEQIVWAAVVGLIVLLLGIADFFVRAKLRETDEKIKAIHMDAAALQMALRDQADANDRAINDVRLDLAKNYVSYEKLRDIMATFDRRLTEVAADVKRLVSEHHA